MRKLASIQTVTATEPIPNADAIERLRILGWCVVGKKGEFRPLSEQFDQEVGGRLNFKVINPRFLLKYDD